MVVASEALGLPHEPEPEAVEEVVAREARNTHVEEDALQHRLRQELQHGSQEERTSDQHLRALTHVDIIYEYVKIYIYTQNISINIRYL